MHLMFCGRRCTGSSKQSTQNASHWNYVSVQQVWQISCVARAPWMMAQSPLQRLLQEWARKYTGRPRNISIFSLVHPVPDPWRLFQIVSGSGRAEQSCVQRNLTSIRHVQSKMFTPVINKSERGKGRLFGCFWETGLTPRIHQSCLGVWVHELQAVKNFKLSVRAKKSVFEVHWFMFDVKTSTTAFLKMKRLDSFVRITHVCLLSV